MPSVTVEVDVDLDYVIDEISDADLIQELERRVSDGRPRNEKLGKRAKVLLQSESTDDRTIERLAEHIAAGETAEALDELARLFPKFTPHNAIAFARRSQASMALS